MSDKKMVRMVYDNQSVSDGCQMVDDGRRLSDGCQMVWGGYTGKGCQMVKMVQMVCDGRHVSGYSRITALIQMCDNWFEIWIINNNNNLIIY